MGRHHLLHEREVPSHVQIEMRSERSFDFASLRRPPLLLFERDGQTLARFIIQRPVLVHDSVPQLARCETASEVHRGDDLDCRCHVFIRLAVDRTPELRQRTVFDSSPFAFEVVEHRAFL